jgi:hypothetical protein
MAEYYNALFVLSESSGVFHLYLIFDSGACACILCVDEDTAKKHHHTCDNG